MVSGTDLFLGLFNNLAIFIFLIAVYDLIISYFVKSPLLTRQALIGFSFGLFAIACMHAKIPVVEGVIVDQRNTIVALSGAFGGPFSAIVSAIIAGSYRIYLGGAGALGGSIGICLAALAGAVVYKLRDKIDSVLKLSLSALAAAIIILPGFLFIKDLQTGWGLLKAMALPYGLATFIGLFFVGLLLALQEHRHSAVVELKKSEKRYRESQQRLDLALSGANEGIWDWDPQNNEVHFDSRFYTVTGYLPYEFPSTYKEWEKRVHPDDIQIAVSSVNQCLAGDTDNFDAEFRFLHKDGHYVWIHSKGNIVARNEQGKPIRMIGTHADITQRKTIEESLRATQFIYDKASIGIHRIGSDGKIIDVNRQAAENLGYSVEELRGQYIFDIDPYAKPEFWEKKWHLLCEKGSDYVERTHRRKDGSEMPVAITANLLELEGKQFSVTFVQDITERKKWENNLKASERRYQDLFNKAPIGYMVTDHIGDEPIIREVNDSFLKLIGYSRQEVLNTPVSRYYTEASRKQLKKVNYQQQRATNGYLLRGERDLLTSDNKVINTILQLHPRYDTNNTLIGMRAMYLDITARKKAEKETKRLANALTQAQKMEAIGTLAGGIAHDFNNILGAIVGYTQLAQMSSLENPKVQEYTNQVCIASERAKGLIQQILAFSRQSNIEKLPVDIGVIIKETLKLIRASIPSTIEIQQNVKSNLGPVEANQTHIHQVVLNLCTNAAHAMEDNGGTLTVDLLPVRINKSDSSNFDDIDPGSYLKLSIADTGHGMDAYTISRIFEPYFTTKEVGEGTGMGLSLVHGIVKDHGGAINIYSEIGVGTTFHILLPTIEDNAKKSTSASDSLPKGDSQVLFVDDEKPLVDIGRDLLETLGYHVETRTSPNDALEAVRAKPDKYDLVISDMTMPKMNGDKLAEQIKEIRSDLPIIICTGFSKKMSSEKTREMGINSVLMKPLTLADLANTVRKVLDEANQSANK